MSLSGQGRVMRNDDDRRAGLVDEFELIKNKLGILGVEVAGGFISQKDIGLGRHSPGDGEALLLAA